MVATYALYSGWPEDAKRGPLQYRKSSLTMVGILCMSILSSWVMTALLKFVGNAKVKAGSSSSSVSEFQDGAAKREQKQRGFEGMLPWGKRA